MLGHKHILFGPNYIVNGNEGHRKIYSDAKGDMDLWSGRWSSNGYWLSKYGEKLKENFERENIWAHWVV